MRIEEFYQLFLEFRKISTDSRKVIPNSIFFALKGDNFNGNLYALEAINKGCSRAVVDENVAPGNKKIIQVPDVLSFMQDLAHHHRSRFSIPLLAVTGTNGKTTTKELITAVLKSKYNTVATKGNLNNHIGVPLTLMEIDQNTEIAVVEMGANHVGEISRLCEIADPDFGLITNIGRAHLEGFGSPARVKEAKNELYQCIRENGGMVFINSDDAALTGLAGDLRRVSYGKSDTAVVQGNDPGNIFSSVLWKSPPEINDWQKLQTRLVGGYNFYNILAAVCIGNYFGIDPESIARTIESYEPGLNRSQYIETDRNRVVMDAYNANPDSMNAAVSNFRNYLSDRKVAVLGDMFELGSYSYQAHREVIENIEASPFCKVLLVGEQFTKAAEGAGHMVFKDVDSLAEYLGKNPLDQSLVLLKGSRRMELEKLLVYL